MSMPPLTEVSDPVAVKGIEFPGDVDISKLVITGPPGAGKSTFLRTLGGWSEEGYLDLSSPGWWRSPLLEQRPRELHFGVPFVGYEEAVPVYDLHVLDDPHYLELDLSRITVPPPNGGLMAPNFRKRLFFEFLLPPPALLFERRQGRGQRLTHHIDRGITLDQIRQEHDFLASLAHFFHTSGLNVYVRQAHDGPPMRFQEGVEERVALRGRKRKDLRKRHDTLKLKQRVLNRTWSLRGNKAIVDLFVRLLPGALQVERCHIYVHDPTKQEAWLFCGTHVSKDQVAASDVHPLVSDVLSSGEYCVQESMRDALFTQNGRPFVLRNTLIVPIKNMSGTGQTGAIQVLNKKGGKGYFEECDRKVLERVAKHLQLAFENIFLRREMMDLSDLLSMAGEHDATKHRFLIALLTTLLMVSVGLNLFTYYEPVVMWLLDG